MATDSFSGYSGSGAKMRLTPWENVKQLSSTAWENWLSVSAALIVLISSVVAIAYPYYSSWAAKQQAQKDMVNTSIQNLSRQVGDLQLKLATVEANAKNAQDTAKGQEQRLDDILLKTKVDK